MDNTIENKTLQELQSRFEALCDEQEQLPREGFAKVFEVLDELEETFTSQHPYTENEDNINKALELTGHSTDEAFCKAFKRNNQIMIEGKEIQAKGLEIFTMQQCEKIKEKPHNLNEWQFVPIRIFAPKELMNNVINPRLKTDAKEGKGLYGNITDIPEEKESLDEWFDIEAYGVKCSLEPLYRDLQNYGVVDSVLENDTIKDYYLKAIKGLIYFIRDNTDKPNRIRNHISKILKGLDDIPAFGLLLQILLLQGLIKWFENVNLKEGDNGYNEASNLVQWIGKQLMKKEIRFCYFRWGEDDKKWLKPFCDYLLSTEIGKTVQNYLLKKPIDCNFIVDGENGTRRILKDSQSNITTDEKKLPSKQNKSTKRGRQSKPFKEYLQNEDKLHALHSVMNEKTGKEAALAMKVAIQIGWITKPTFKAVTDEFGDIGNRSNYNKYINGDRFTKDEIEGMKNALLSY
ncbi:hypothetical protein [Bacteroides fluxus]|uniref:hypothetical protein n=1 Tax=Bacteroides fluxus TaxID=626930 RepID=UPI0026728C1B|nr:hypothetical protein [Bacteroides fluxus]